MILSNGIKVLVVHRRLFEKDHSRYFIGTIEGYESGIAKVKGRTFLKDPFSKRFLEKPDERTKIFSVSSGTLLVYELPINLQLDSITFNVNSTGAIHIADGGSFAMDLSEFPLENS